MVVLNFYGKIDPVCISKKLGLYISNLPNEKGNEWKKELASDLALAVKIDKIYKESVKSKVPCAITELYQRVFPNEKPPKVFSQYHYKKIVDKMICIYQDYDYSDMPLGGWDTNCFDGRFCEEEYVEKIINFINFLARSFPNLHEPVPQWIYSTNHDEIDHFRIFWGGEPALEYIRSLKTWGKIFDNFLQSMNDYLLFDYLVNTIHKDNEYNANHLSKAYALCQLFLEREKESELDWKLPLFFSESLPDVAAKRQAVLFRKMRNKIDHGDFLAFEKVIETYTVEFLDGNFAFDYTEYSRKNWTILHVCCELDDAVRKMIYMLLFNRTELDKIKNCKENGH